MADTKGLAEPQRRALDRLSTLSVVSRFYLAGGTAVALHLGHRVSRDLDLFSRDPDVDLDEVKGAVRGVFASAETVRQTDAAVQLLCDGAPIDLVRYPYRLLEVPPLHVGAVAVASLLDLATMKLSAIARRGLARDFWDLHEIATRGAISLRDASAAYVRRFGVAESDLYHVFRALTYFEDAERDPVLPDGLTTARWREIEAFFKREVPRLIEG